MLFKVAPKLAQSYPGLKIGVVVAKNIVNSQNQESLNNILKNQQTELNQTLDLQKLLSHPFIKSWQDAYKKFGMNPKDFTPSVEALSRRVLKSGGFNPVNTLVDIYNYISIKYFLPLGAEDLDKIQGNLELTFATETEKPVLLLGQKEPSKAKLGEVIYKDDEGIICRSWNWREAARTIVRPDSKNVIIVLEALEAVPFDIVKTATFELAYLIKKYCSGDIYFDFVDNQHIELDLNNIKKFDDKLFTQAKYDIYTFKQEIAEHHESKEFEIRVQKVHKLIEMGINPWPENKEIDSHSDLIKKEFTGEEGKEYTIAGRLMTIRSHGKSIFANLQDQSGTIQIYIKQDKVGHDQFELFNNFIDTGDIVWVKGSVFKTKTLEITLQCFRIYIVK